MQYRDILLHEAGCIFSLDSVYVHLCMSIALMYCVDMATRVKQFLPPSVPMILVFLHMKL